MKMTPGRLVLPLAACLLGVAAWKASRSDDVAPNGRKAAPGSEVRSFRPAPEEGEVGLRSSVAGLRASFGAEGVVVKREEGAEWTFRLRATAIGRGTERRPASGGTPAMAEGEVVYEHGWGREWFAPHVEGVEQFFEVHDRIPGAEPLEIFLELDGLTVSRVTRDRAVFASGGKDVLEYRKLIVRGADGSAVAARMDADGAGLKLVIEDASAKYPLWVDPILALPVQETPDRAAWTTNGDVYAIASDGAGTVYIGGEFTRVGRITGAGASLSPITGRPDVPIASINGAVRAVVSDGMGGWYVGGAFTQVQDVPRNRLAHLLADGRLDPDWNPDANWDVYSLALDGATLYVGGAFTDVGGEPHSYIVALDTVTGAPRAWGPSINGPVYGLAVDGSSVYLGGEFNLVDGMGRSRLAAIDGVTGAILPWNPNADRTVRALVAEGDFVYAGGDFTLVGGAVRNHLAAIEVATGQPSAWNPNSDAAVHALAIDGPTLMAGGVFTTIGGASRTYVAELNLFSGLATPWAPSPDGAVQAIAVGGSVVYIGGIFQSVDGASIPHLAALDGATGTPLAWAPHPDSNVVALAADGTSVFAGGSFGTIGGVARNYLAAIDVATGVPTSWDPNADGLVATLELDGGTVYAGGIFTTMGSGAGLVSRRRLAALDAVTGAPTAWNPNANDIVYSLDVDGSVVYVGGAFYTIGGTTRTYLAAIDRTTGLPTPWNPGMNSFVASVVADGSTVYAGGSFTQVGGVPRNYLAAIDATTGTALPWDPDPNGDVIVMSLEGATLYVGGGFTLLGGLARGRLAAVDTASGLPTSWNPDADGTVYGLAVRSGCVYAGGNFATVGGATRWFLAELDSATGAATPWDPDSPGPVYALSADPNALYSGGTGVHYTAGGFSIFSATRAVQVTSPAPDGSYTVGQSVPIEIVFSGDVTVTGTPRILLETGVVDAYAVYTGGSGTQTLSFSYPVAAGEVSNDLEVASALALDGMGGSLVDADGNPVSLQLPLPFHSGSLSSNRNLVINDGIPTRPSITQPASGTFTNDPTPLVFGTADSLMTVDVYVGPAWIGTTSSDGTGAWGLTASVLAEGTYILTAVATNAFGTASAPSLPVVVTVDTTGPVSAIVSPPDGTVTNGDTVTLAGTSEPGATVTVYDGPTPLGTAPTNGAGGWSFVTPFLLEGFHSFVVDATDAAGNAGAFSSAVGVWVDRTLPPVPTIDLPADGTTTTSNVVDLEGTAEPNGTVQVYDGLTLIGSVSVAGAGNWTFSTAPLSNGTHDFSVQVIDGAGNVSGSSSTVSVTVNAGANPAIEITSPTSNPTYISASPVVVLGGTVTNGGAGASVSWNNQTTGALGPAAGTAVWSASVPLAAGTNVIVVAVSSAAGSATDLIAVDYTPPPDVTPPIVAITLPSVSPATVSASPATIEGTASDDTAVALVQWSNGATGASGGAVGTTAWSADVPLVTGPNVITITAVDGAGNAAAATVTIDLVPPGGDVVPPTIAITSPTSGASISSSVDTILIGGTAADETLLVTVEWSNAATGGSGTAAGLDPWSAAVPLTFGTNVITFTAYDSSGNTAADVLTVTYSSGTVTVGSSDESCGLLGLDVMALIALATAWRRRFRGWASRSAGSRS